MYVVNSGLRVIIRGLPDIAVVFNLLSIELKAIMFVENKRSIRTIKRGKSSLKLNVLNLKWRERYPRKKVKRSQKRIVITFPSDVPKTIPEE
jgi:hypothetical protein